MLATLLYVLFIGVLGSVALFAGLALTKLVRTALCALPCKCDHAPAH